MKLTNLTVPVTSLTQHPNNPRIHGKENIAYIKKSLKTFHQYTPIIVDKENQTILAGNGTFQAAIELGYTEIDTIQIEGLSENQKNAIIIADNKLNESSYWLKDSLKELSCPFELLNSDFTEFIQKLLPEKKEKNDSTQKTKPTCPFCNSSKKIKILEVDKSKVVYLNKSTSLPSES